MTIIVILGLIYLLQSQEVVSNEGEVQLNTKTETQLNLEDSDDNDTVESYNFETDTESMINDVLDTKEDFENTNQDYYQQDSEYEPVVENMEAASEEDNVDTVFDQDLTGGQKQPDVMPNDLEAPSVFEGKQDVRKKNMDKLMKQNNNKKALFKADDLLPNDVNKDWFETDFSQAKVKVDQDNLINTERYVVGVNTVGQSLKNASYDLRAAPPNPKVTVSPWNQSSIEPDYNIRPLM